MVNERSLRAVTEPLPPAPRPVGPVGAPSCTYTLRAKLLCCRNYRATGCYLSASNGSPDRYRYHLVSKRGQGGLAFEPDPVTRPVGTGHGNVCRATRARTRARMLITINLLLSTIQ